MTFQRTDHPQDSTPKQLSLDETNPHPQLSLHMQGQISIPVIQLIDGFAIAEQSGGAALFALNLARFLRDAKLMNAKSPDTKLSGTNTTEEKTTITFRPIVCGLWQHNAPSESHWRSKIEAAGIQTEILIEKRGNLEKDMVRAHHRLNRLVDEQAAKLINSHFERCDLLALSSKASHRGHVKIVRTVHAERQWLSRPWLGTLVDLFAYPWFFDAEVAIAQGTQSMLDRRSAARLRNRRAHLIYNGLNPDFIEQLSQSTPTIDSVEKLAEDSAGPHLIIVGRLEEQKGHATLIDALPKVLQQQPATTLTIVGAGSLYDALVAQSRALGVHHAIRFLSGRDDVPALLRQSDLFVSSSNWEGFPTVILEAMAAQLPVIATDVGGSRELVRNGETGYLVPPRDPQALADAILRLWEEQELAKQMAIAAQEQIHPFLFPNIAAQYSTLYGKVLRLS